MTPNTTQVYPTGIVLTLQSDLLALEVNGARIGSGLRSVSSLHPTPYTLHSTPYTLHPTPHTLHPAPYTPHPTPYILHPTPYT